MSIQTTTYYTGMCIALYGITTGKRDEETDQLCSQMLAIRYVELWLGCDEYKLLSLIEKTRVKLANIHDLFVTVENKI